MSIDNMQFGFMSGKRTNIFIMRQVQEAKKKKLYYAFVRLEKEFDIPREVVRWALRKLGVDEWLIVYRGLNCS